MYATRLFGLHSYLSHLLSCTSCDSQVETLGDAVYMVAGGVLESRTHQASQVADVALEFMEKVKEIILPVTKQPLQLRAGTIRTSCTLESSSPRINQIRII